MITMSRNVRHGDFIMLRGEKFVRWNKRFVLFGMYDEQYERVVVAGGMSAYRIDYDYKEKQVVGAEGSPISIVDGRMMGEM